LTSEVLASVTDGIGTITLNRPNRINALSGGMIARLTEILERWAGDERIVGITIQGAGQRGYCAGADVRILRDWVLAGRADEALGFLFAEYRLDGLVAAIGKPVTAYLRGISMGGGLGLGLHNTRRLGDGTTRLAMPETAIGLWPDVGVCFELARTPGQVGAHLAMTGQTIDGADALWAGLLDECPGADPEDSQLARDAAWIDECYVGDDPVAILDRLTEHPASEARAAAGLLRSRCPMSVAVALQAVRLAAAAPDVAAVLVQDTTLAITEFNDPHDFVEGVRVRMIDRGAEPHWRHAGLAEVDPAEVAARFVS